MSGFDPTFDAAGAGTRDGSVPAPGSIDGRTYFLRADKTWAAPGSSVPGPEPPAPGPDLDQWACNIAGYLTYEVSRLAVKYVVDWLPVSWIGDVAGGIVAGIAGALLPASLLEGGVIEAAIFTWVSSYVSGHATDIGTALLDDVAWAKIHCALYDKIKLTPTDLHAAILAFTAILGGLVGWTTPAVAAISYLFENLGIADVGNIPITAFVRSYDCTTCATTGIGPAKPVLQTSFDLTITDGTTSEPFTDTVFFSHATVTASGQTATVTPRLGVEHNGAAIGVEPNIDLVDSATLTWTTADDPGDSTVMVSGTVPTATSASLGVGRADGQTIGVSSGIYSVIAGSLATVSLDQYGTADSHVAGGATLSGLTVGNTYAVQSTGGPWNPSYPGAYVAYSWQMSNDGGSTWDNVYADDTINPTSPTAFVPSWAITAERTDSHHARVVFVAAATSIRFRAAGTNPAVANGTLGWQLLDVSYEPTSVRFEHNGAKVATRPSLDFEDSASVTATLTDDPTNDRLKVSLTAAGFASPMSAKGDLIVGGTSGTPDRLPVGSANTLLQSVPGATDGLQWVLLQASDIPSLPAARITTGTIAQAQGGTGLDTSGVNDGDLLVGTSAHGWRVGGIGGGNGITVSETAGIFTVASNITAGTNITIAVVAGAVQINATGGGGGGGFTTVLLNYTATADLANAVSMVAGSWHDVPNSSQSFTVTNAAALVAIFVSGYGRQNIGTGSELGCALSVDGTRYLIGGFVNDGASAAFGGNVLTGVGPVYISGLSVASHTAKLQIYISGTGGNMFWQPSTSPNVYSYNMLVLEQA